MTDYPYDEQAKYYEAKLCEKQDRIEELEDHTKMLQSLAETYGRQIDNLLDRIKELAWTGRVISGSEALEMGLITELHDDPLAAAMEMAAAIRVKSPDAIRAMKRLFNTAWGLPEADALALEAELQHGVLGKKNQLEAVMANMQKRAPEFDD